MEIDRTTAQRISTGVAGLDDVLNGGLIPQRAYLVRGGPGTGKTTLGMQFLATGAREGERCLCISFGEPEEQIREDAARIDLDLDGVEFLDLSPDAAFFAEVETYDLFSPADVERAPTTQKIVARIEALKPARIFLDAMTQIRYLAPDAFHFHRQALSFLRFMVQNGATALFSSESSGAAPDEDLQFLSDGIVNLDLTARGRRLSVSKFRGSGFRKGHHSMRLTDTGMVVTPKLVPEEHRRTFSAVPMPSGIPELDALLHGGVERGTITIITGPTGVGKSTLGAQFMKEAAGRGERSVLFTFEEEVGMLLARCEAVQIPLRAMIDRGILSLVKVEPLQLTPDEFSGMVRHEVEELGTSIVMIDSLEGYHLALSGEDLISHLHALCKYLQNMGATTLLINEKEKMAGAFTATEAGISYLADNIIYLRYLEQHTGTQLELRKSIGVLKKRLSAFDSTLREMEITRYGLKVKEPMAHLSTILNGTPVQVRNGDA